MTNEMLDGFREQGFVVVPDVLTGDQIDFARRVVAAMLRRKPFWTDHVGPHFLWPRFNRADHPLLDLYRRAGIADRVPSTMG